MEALTSSSFSPSSVLLPDLRCSGRTMSPAVRFPSPRIHAPSSVIANGRRRPASRWVCSARDGDGGEAERRDGEGGMDGGIPCSPGELVKRVSSRSYDLRRQLKQTMDSIGYDVVDSNPWREYPKPVYVLTHRENQLCTMKTRTNRSRKELGMLFSKQTSYTGKRSKQTSNATRFNMLVEDIRDGILVFEDEHDAVRYCDLLQGGRGCEGIAEVEASSVFDICHKMRALAVLFRRGRTPPLPETLELNLKARNRSLED